MKVNWCEVHNQTGHAWCAAGSERLGPDGGLLSCRMVPMRLIPDNEETVERIAKVLQRDWEDTSLDVLVLADAQAVWDALDGETP